MARRKKINPLHQSHPSNPGLSGTMLVQNRSDSRTTNNKIIMLLKTMQRQPTEHPLPTCPCHGTMEIIGLLTTMATSTTITSAEEVEI